MKPGDVFQVISKFTLNIGNCMHFYGGKSYDVVYYSCYDSGHRKEMYAVYYVRCVCIIVDLWVLLQIVSKQKDTHCKRTRAHPNFTP